MWVLRFLGKLILVLIMAVLGNFLGAQLRSIFTGKPAHVKVSHTNAQGDQVLGFNIAFTNLLPAIFLGLAGKPAWLTALINGVIFSALMGDKMETRLWNMLIREQNRVVIN